MTKTQYIARIRARYSRSRRIRTLVVFGPMSILTAAFLFVRNGAFFGIPEAVVKYMMDTNPPSFSSSALRDILTSSPPTSYSLDLLIFLYWFPFVLSVPLIATFLFPRSLRAGSLLRLPSWVRGLLFVARIQDAISTSQKLSSSDSKPRKVTIPTSPHLYYALSPIRQAWYTKPEHQWLGAKALDKEAFRVVTSISKMEETAQFALSNQIHLDEITKVLDLLSDFFFSVASRTEKELIPVDQSRSSQIAQERLFLLQAADILRPIILQHERHKRRDKPPSRFTVFTSRLFRTSTFRTAFGISSVAAGVMLIGALFFDIPKDQAFLAWFTVTFGSLTISIGIQSIRLKHSQGDPAKDLPND